MGYPIVLTTSGCYSDYSVEGIFYWKSDKQPKEIFDEWLEAHPEQREEYRFSSSEFVGWLNQIGAIEDVPFKSMHLGDYCRVEECELPELEMHSVTFEALKGILTRLLEAKGRHAVRLLLQQFGAEKLADLLPSTYEATYNEAAEILDAQG